jgi:hypothetical protein
LFERYLKRIIDGKNYFITKILVLLKNKNFLKNLAIIRKRYIIVFKVTGYLLKTKLLF